MPAHDLIYTEAQLMSSHDYAQPNIINGKRMHGGLDANGTYISPRAKGRSEALAAWTAALEQRGGSLFSIDDSLLSGPMVPNVEQLRLLIRNGLGQTFWNVLTFTGKLEARGRLMASWEFPNLQKVIKQDISQMAIGHLDKGLLVAHGLDEGGEPDKGIGGHDVMWFVARDLVFDENAFPDERLAAAIRRPLVTERNMPELPKEHDALLSYLMTLTMIEVRAEIGFRNSQQVFRTQDLFPDRREAAEQAADVIERIRTDEVIHLQSLRLYLGEIRSLTFNTVDGGEVSGATMVDRVWDALIEWYAEKQPRLIAAKQHEAIKEIVLKHPDGERILREFTALSDLA